MRIILTIIFLFCFSFVSAQYKYEKEIRIKKAEVPGNALDLIDALEIEFRNKWYKEFNLNSIHYELKFRKDRRLWSIEFDESGQLEDIEILYSFKSLKPDEREVLKSFLDQRYSKWSLDRLQRQYVPSNISLQDLLNRLGPVYNYEFELRIREDKEWRRYEYLVDPSFNVLSKRPIRSSADLNLEF